MHTQIVVLYRALWPASRAVLPCHVTQREFLARSGLQYTALEQQEKDDYMTEQLTLVGC